MKCNVSTKLRSADLTKMKDFNCQICKARLKLQCLQCNSLFKSQISLKTHLSQTCNVLRRFCCSKCNYVTKRKANLKVHIAGKHGEKLEQHQCPKCSRSYKSLRTMRRHEKDCGNTVLILCEYCSYSTVIAEYYGDHLRKVHNVRRQRKGRASEPLEY